jgi:hypothetical protein
LLFDETENTLPLNSICHAIKSGIEAARNWHEDRLDKIA